MDRCHWFFDSSCRACKRRGPAGHEAGGSAVGYELQLAATEPNVLNMIALSVDVDGRIYLAETDRYQDAVFDVVTLRPDWLPADLSFRQVRDRTDF